jgi:hypothetical protein
LLIRGKKWISNLRKAPSSWRGNKARREGNVVKISELEFGYRIELLPRMLTIAKQKGEGHAKNI